MKLRDLFLNNLVKINPKFDYKGNDPDVLRNKCLLLIKNGYIMEFVEFCNNLNYLDENNVLVITEIIEEFASAIKDNISEFTNPEFFKLYALDLAKRGDKACLEVCVPGENTNVDIVCSIIQKYPHFMRYYKGLTFYDVTDAETKKREAMSKVHDSLSTKTTINYNLAISGTLLFSNMFEDGVYYCFDEKVLMTYAKMIEAGYNPAEDLKINSNLRHFPIVMKAAVSSNLELISLYEPSNYLMLEENTFREGYDETVFQIYLENGGQINRDILTKNKFLGNSSLIMKNLVDYDLELFFELLSQASLSLESQITSLLTLSRKPAKEIYAELLEKRKYEILNILCESSTFVIELMKDDISFVEYYSGNDDSVFKLYVDTCKKNNRLLDEKLLQKDNFKSSDIFMDAIITQNPTLIREYSGKSKTIYENYLKAGNIPTIDIICYNELFCTLIPRDVFMQIIESTDSILLGNLLFDAKSASNLKKTLLETKFKNLPLDLNTAKVYSFNKGLLIEKYDVLEQFFKDIDISFELFFAHSFSSDYDWLHDIIRIIENDGVESFRYIKNHFADTVFKTDNEYIYMKNINLILKNYTKYPELCNNILTLNRDLTEKETNLLNYLFNLNVTLEDEYIPKDISDLSNIGDLLKRNYQAKLDEYFVKKSFHKTDDIKNLICTYLFNNSFLNIQSILRKYGTTQELRQLQFDNKDHPNLVFKIEQLLVLTSMMERIKTMDNLDDLMELSKNILENFDTLADTIFIFGDYEQKISKIYEMDIQKNLTKLTGIKNIDKILDKEKTQKYGVEVLDFSESQYIILAHVKSPSETVDEVVNGKSSRNKKTICLSSISHRYQKYYTKGNIIIFGCTSFPSRQLICSAKENFSSNSYLAKYGVGVSISDISGIEQRGILESSAPEFNINNEYFCWREGLKFDCIILPDGREPTEEEIKIAKEYNLKFVITQQIERRIKNPQKIEYIDEDEQLGLKKSKELMELEKLREMLFSISNDKKTRKIAVFSDAHALFEPTLAILEDARKSGITEIYSLGDNVGTGPNPKEVLELLEKYNVKSIMGNHEMYTIGQLEELKKHLIATGAYDSAKANSDWTRSKLTGKQIEDIKLYPHILEIVLGGKKIALCHHIRDYNTGEVIVDPKAYDLVLQGHIHFESEKDNVKTLRGAGIGSKNVPNQAYYLIITEKPDGGYDIEKRNVEFKLGMLHHDINASDLSDDDKAKIENWTGHSK